MMNFLKEAIHSTTEEIHRKEKEKEKIEEKDKEKGIQEEKRLQTQPLKDVLPKGEESKNKDKDIGQVNESLNELNLKDVKIQSVKEPTIIEKEVEAPIMKETVIPQVNELVQPVIIRDTERTQVKHITQPIFNKDVLPTERVDTELPATTMATTVQKPNETEVRKYQQAHNRETNEYEVLPPQITRTVLPPIVKERVTPIIHEEIQPVIYQETIQPVVISETKPIYHKVVEAPTVVEEERPFKTMDEAKSLLDKVGSTTVTTVSGQEPRKKGEGQQ